MVGAAVRLAGSQTTPGQAPAINIQPLFAACQPASASHQPAHTRAPRLPPPLPTCLPSWLQNFVISDPSLPDCPIVFASDAFLELTGYPREEVLGRNW